MAVEDYIRNIVSALERCEWEMNFDRATIEMYFENKYVGRVHLHWRPEMFGTYAGGIRVLSKSTQREITKELLECFQKILLEKYGLYVYDT